jgi:trk system potassium uptake protein TrkA
MSEVLSTEIFARELLALSNLCQQGMSLLMIQISPVSTAAGCPVPELDLPRDCVLVAVIRDEQVLYPRGDTTLQPWDRVFAVVDRASEEGLREALTRLP